MSLKKFERVYYEYSWGIITPEFRIRYDEQSQSFVMQEPDWDVADGVDVYDYPELVEGELVDYEFWNSPHPATLGEVIEVLKDQRFHVPQQLGRFLLDDPDEGHYWSGRTAGTFYEDEEITLDDIKLFAFEVLDEDWAERDIPYRGKCLYRDDDEGTVIAMFPYDDNIDDWVDADEELRGKIREKISEENIEETLPSPDDLASLSCAVLTKEYAEELAEGEWAVYAAFATREMAEEWASAVYVGGLDSDCFIIREIKS